MSEEAKKVTVKGLGIISTFLVVLSALFVAFKLAGVITWSWWAVLIPVYALCGWMCCGLAIIVIIIILVVIWKLIVD